MIRTAAATRTAAVTGLALAALTLGTPAALAAPGADTDGQRPAHGVVRVCTEVEAFLARLPLPAPAPVPVCKLVNGWD
ncbi:hypothetical protein ACFVFH_20300 [Streptomyces sp. NPDC057697]|uniref:hypothetical protein n=1 Tax=Streptomyces sp. NPDC057697 TaxID=3346219 RepID=UPI0036C0C1FC